MNKTTSNNIMKWAGLLFFLSLTIAGYYQTNILVSMVGGILLGYSVKDLSSFFVLRVRTGKTM